jgi:hypothetical protein
MALSLRPLAAIALVALICAGCSNAPAEAGSAAQASSNPELAAKLPEYAKCMRDNGVKDFPDPDDKGIIEYRGEKDSPEFKSAKEKCRALRPEGGRGKKQ